MKKKIVVTFLVGIFLLTSITSLSIAETKTKLTEGICDNQLNTQTLGKCEMVIGRLPFKVLSQLFITTPTSPGDFKAEYTVEFRSLESYERIEGYWFVSIFVSGNPKIVFFNTYQVPFDYSGDNKPDDVYEQITKYIPKGTRMMWVQCGVNFAYYLGGEFQEFRGAEDTKSWDGYFPKTHFLKNPIFSHILLGILEKHPHMFPILRHLLGL